ncbi:hypothetical protein [Gordonia sp. NPDC127522]|uniref:hypothetical protein n=1 Tax=Gordonia sp. NPDC127522 TaxID=3345390 RepID=UPI0036364841
MQPLACRRCGTGVLVKKNSLAQTSVQWGDSSSCVELGRIADVNERARYAGCSYLRDSIDEAVRARLVEVPDLDG